MRFYHRRVLIVRKDDMTRSRRENVLRLAAWASASLALAACRHAPTSTSLASGQSAFTFIEAPSPTESARQGEMTTGPRQPADRPTSGSTMTLIFPSEKKVKVANNRKQSSALWLNM